MLKEIKQKPVDKVLRDPFKPETNALKYRCEKVQKKRETGLRKLEPVTKSVCILSTFDSDSKYEASSDGTDEEMACSDTAPSETSQGSCTVCLCFRCQSLFAQTLVPLFRMCWCAR